MGDQIDDLQPPYAAKRSRLHCAVRHDTQKRNDMQIWKQLVDDTAAADCAMHGSAIFARK